MKKQKKFISAIIALSLTTSAMVLPVTAKAEGVNNYKEAEQAVDLGISDKTFYSYNMAYAKIMQLPNGDEKDALLIKLATIAEEVWTPEITQLVSLIVDMADNKSGRAYDTLEAILNADDKLVEVDREYLKGELTSWGTDTVWTDEYKQAVAGIIEVWNKKTEGEALTAYKAVKTLTIDVNREYLKELLDEAVTKAELPSVEKLYAVDKIESVIQNGDTTGIKIEDITAAGVTGAVTEYIDAYRAVIAAAPDGELDSTVKIQEMIDAVNQIIKDTVIAVIDAVEMGGDTSKITIEDLKATGVTGLVNENLTAYQSAISAAEDGALNTAEKMQAMIDAVNLANQ